MKLKIYEKSVMKKTSCKHRTYFCISKQVVMTSTIHTCLIREGIIEKNQNIQTNTPHTQIIKKMKICKSLIVYKHGNCYGCVAKGDVYILKYLCIERKASALRESARENVMICLKTL